MRALIVLVAAAWVGVSHAAEVAGVKLPDRVRVNAGGSELFLR